jgi:hypothetical protein
MLFDAIRAGASAAGWSGEEDDYSSSSNIDSGSSTYENYDSGNDLYYASTFSASTSGDLTTSKTAIGSASAGDLPNLIDNNTGTKCWSGQYNPNHLNGYLGVDFGSTVEIRKVVATGAPDSDAYGTTMDLDRSSNNSTWVTVKSGLSAPAASAVVTHLPAVIPAGGLYRYWRLKLASAPGGIAVWKLSELEMMSHTDAGTENMTLINNAYTASSAPAEARVTVRIIENDATTINTDFTCEVSRNGGSNWTTASLVYDQTISGEKQYLDTGIDISGQPSGTSMKYRLKCLNNKDIDVSYMFLEWK